MTDSAAKIQYIDSATSNSPFSSCCTLYRQRIDAIALIKQLSQLAISVQQHRGLSMAILAGDQNFGKEFSALQLQLDRRIAVLEAFAFQVDGLLSATERKNIVNSWMTLKNGWQDDRVMDNFELHCHFIDQLLLLMNQLAKQLERPMSDHLQESARADLAESWVQMKGNGLHHIKQLGLLAFVCKQMPDLIELVAKIRGLATHSMVTGHCDPDCSQKLEFLLRCAKEQREKLNLGIIRVSETAKDAISSLPMIKTYDIKLVYMIDKVERDVLASQVVVDDQHGFFELVSEIIDVYVAVVNQGLDMLQCWQEQQLEEWLIKG
ncbi:MAG: hypothetical protein OQK12_09380 [Motiliproteus sp.]|nr:hypothetical protein [Motiliproteus sp.]MCW9053630.1 hypothetical protein [Motiliproteus sp.]